MATAGPEAAPGRVARVVRWLRTGRLGRKLTRYSIGSVVAVATSEVVFSACYGFGWLGTTASSVVAFVAGAIPNWVLNRRWAWQRRGRVRIGREVILYAGISVVSLVAAAVSTKLASRAAPEVTANHDLKVALVALAYLASNAVLFGLKFGMYEVVVFTDKPDPGSGGSANSPPSGSTSR